MVHSFTGATTFGLEVPCTADLEVVAARYVSALPDGEVPLTMHFTGRILYEGPQRQVQVVHLPWTTSASYQMPVSVWRNMMKHHHGESGFVLAAQRHARRAHEAQARPRPAQLRRGRPRPARAGAGRRAGRSGG